MSDSVVTDDTRDGEGRRSPGGPRPTGDAALAARGLSKTFGGSHALIEVDLTIRPGEVHGLVGENGSGKSTLIKILSGYHAPDAGQLEVFGRHVSLPLRAGESRALGMEFVHQDLGLIPSLSVTENLRFASMATRRPVSHISWRHERRRVMAALEHYGVRLDPRSKVEDLAPVEQALVAIVRAVESMRTAMERGGGHHGLLVLDEATVFLPRDHVERLFAVMRQLAAEGSSVLFVSHQLDEVREVADRVTVLRNGRLIDTVESAATSEDEMIQLIIGHELEIAARRGSALADSQGALHARDLRGRLLRGASFDVARGEVLGLTGLVGSGFEEAPHLLYGAVRAQSGTLSLSGDPLPLRSMTPGRALRMGVVLVPGDRQRDGGVAALSVVDNITLPRLNAYFDKGLLRRVRMKREARALMDAYEVRPPTPQLEYGSLSGGNQQKALLAKWLQTEPALLLLHEPTQGVDVGAREAIFGLVRAAAARGCATVCASCDYEQLALICDRVLIFGEGVIVSELSGPEVTKEQITAQSLSSIGAVALAAGGAGNVNRQADGVA